MRQPKIGRRRRRRGGLQLWPVRRRRCIVLPRPGDLFCVRFISFKFNSTVFIRSENPAVVVALVVVVVVVDVVVAAAAVVSVLSDYDS